jgi:hypothetical protein
MDFKPHIEKDGQAYFDEPVRVYPKARGAIDLSVEAAFKPRRPREPITVRHDRVRLRWMKPDGKGGLTPR